MAAGPPEPPRTEIRPPAAAPAQNSLLLIIVVVVAGLYLAREVLVPIALAVLLSFVLTPLVDLLRRLGLWRTPSVLLAITVALGVILAIGGIIGTQAAGLADELPYYSNTIERKIDAIRSATLGRVTDFAQNIGRRLAAPEKKPTSDTGSEEAGKSVPPVPVIVQQPAPAPLDLVGRYLSPALSPFATLGIVIVVTIFILLQQQDLRDRVIRLIGSNDLHRTTIALDDGAQRLSRYFLTQLAVNIGFGCAITVGLLLIGVPQPALWGVISALLRFVPYIGTGLSAVFPIALAAAVDSGWSMFAWTLALYVVVELVISQGIEPLVYGRRTGLSPVAVITSAIFWSWIWGPIGLVLSTPLTLCLVVLGRHVQRLEFLEVMLGDRPALTPVESFYQRLLAGDADEAREQAEALLKERSLSEWYDEVALPGLQLAAADAERGVLRGDQLERVREAIRNVVEELEPNEDEKASVREAGNGAPAAEMLDVRVQNDAAVLCLAGRGPLDDAVAMIFMQLLRQHGTSARLVPYQAVSRRQISELKIPGVMMMCIFYLNIRGRPAHLRYLLQRLRQRQPHASILVGLWPPDDPTPRDLARRQELGVDYSATSLCEAVEACLQVTRLRSGKG